MFVPLTNHHLPAQRIHLQAEAPETLLKKAWTQIVREKITAQARVLEEFEQDDHGLFELAKKVKSGDPHNVEAQAARRYWSYLFKNQDFKRLPEGDDPINLRLNFGYGVLRGVTARAACAVGFHPALGLHHHNKYNTYCLADDLMEPFRPMVDRAVRRQLEDGPLSETLTPSEKTVLLEPLLCRYLIGGQQRTLFDCVTRLAFSLVQLFSRERTDLEIAKPIQIAAPEKPF